MPEHSAVHVILLALRRGQTPDAWRAAWPAGLDSDDVVVAAVALGLAPLLHWRLETWGEGLPESRAQAKLNFIRQAEVAREAARQAQLAEALDRLPAQAVVLKGAYLADKVYPAPGTRPMNDIDLLFRPEDLPAVEGVLRDLGYAGKQKPPELGPGVTKNTSTFQRPGSQAATPNPYLSGEGHRMLEPHRSLEESWFGLKCDLTPGAWDRSQAMTIAGRPARVLAPADNLLHLLVHLAFHLIMGSPSLVQLADLEMFTDRVPVDWEEFLARARALKACGFAYAAASLAVAELGAAFPPEVLQALRDASPPGARSAAEALDLAQLMRRTQQPPLRTVAQRLRRGVADRLETARWAQSPAEWLRIWWTLLDFRRTDTWRILTRQAAS